MWKRPPEAGLGTTAFKSLTGTTNFFHISLHDIKNTHCFYNQQLFIFYSTILSVYFMCVYELHDRSIKNKLKPSGCEEAQYMYSY